MLKSLTPEDTLHFCSGYLNPPDALAHVLAEMPAELHLLSADPRSNGFFNTKFPKSGITPAYQLFADHMIEKLSERDYTLQEWYRQQVSQQFFFNVACKLVFSKISRVLARTVMEHIK